MVDINSGITILPELSIVDYTEDQLNRIRYFKSPEPVREISLVTTQNFVKKKAIDALSQEIMEAIPEKFKTKKKKEVLSFQ